MSFSKAQTHDGNVDDEIGFPSKLQNNELRRLILIDGFNIMHHFKDMCLDDRTFSEKMCPLVLIPFVYSLIKEGFVVRIVLRNQPRENRVTDSFVLNELESANLCIYGLHEDVEEEDDLLMLQLAKQYGAIIISRDKFRNHRNYEDIAKNNVVAFDKVPTRFFESIDSIEQLVDELFFKYTIELHDNPERFIVDPSDDDYELVQKSHKKFDQISEGNFETMKILYMYVQSYFCYVYNLGIPYIVWDFIEENSFPMTYRNFVVAYDRRMNYRRKYNICDEDVEEKEEDTFSTNGLEYIIDDDEVV